MSLRDSVDSSPTMAVWSLAAVLLLAAGSPPFDASGQRDSFVAFIEAEI